MVDPRAYKCDTFSTRLELSIQFMQTVKRSGDTLLESNTNGERSWFNSPDTDTNFWTGLDGQ